MTYPAHISRRQSPAKSVLAAQNKTARQNPHRVASGGITVTRYHCQMLEQRIEQHFIDSADLKYQSAQVLCKPIAAAVQAILASVTSGGKVLVCGNGGSAAVGQHFVAEFVGRYERERPELAAIALTTNSSILTAIANDYDFNVIFSKQVRALGGAGDVLLAMSTSGNSANVLAAIEAAHERDMTVVALTGRGGGKMGRAAGTSVQLDENGKVVDPTKPQIGVGDVAKLRTDLGRVELTVETRGPEHLERVLARLREAGYEVEAPG